MVQIGNRPRGRPRGFDRDAALHGALRLFARAGYEGATIAELTEATGLPVKSLYNTFGSKEALFEEAVGLFERTEGAFAQVALDEGATAFDAVARLLREAAVRYTTGGVSRGCMLALSLLRCNASSDPVADRMKARRTAARGSIRARLERGRVAGDLDAGADLDELASFYVAQLQGMSVRARDGATTADLAAIAEFALLPLRAISRAPAGRRRRPSTDGNTP